MLDVFLCVLELNQILLLRFKISLICIFPLQLQELANQLMDLWNLMDTPMEERKLFDHVTRNMLASVDEVSVPKALALDLIEQVFGFCK